MTASRSAGATRRIRRSSVTGAPPPARRSARCAPRCGRCRSGVRSRATLPRVAPDVRDPRPARPCASARAPGSAGGTSTPFVASTISGTPPTSVATIGQPECDGLHERHRQALVVRGENEGVASAHDAHRVGPLTEQVDEPGESQPGVLRVDLRLEGPLADREEPHRHATVAQPGRGGEQVGVVLLGPEVGDGAEHDGVLGDAELGAHPGAVARPLDRLEVDPVHQRLGPGREPVRHGGPHQLRHGEVGRVGAHGPLVEQPRRRGEAPPCVVERVHRAGPGPAGQRPGDQPPDAGGIRRLRVEHVGRLAVQQRPQAARPAHVALVTYLEARRPHAVRLEVGNQLPLPRQEVGTAQVEALGVVPAGGGDEQTLHPAGPESLDQPHHTDPVSGHSAPGTTSDPAPAAPGGTATVHGPGRPGAAGTTSTVPASFPAPPGRTPT